MTGWWHHAVTFGDVVLLAAAVVLLCLLAGGVLLLAHWGKEVARGLRDGWNKSGKSFWTEVAERVEKKRSSGT